MWFFILIVIVIFIVCISNHNKKKEREVKEQRERQRRKEAYHCQLQIMQRRGTVYPQQNNTVTSKCSKIQTSLTQQKNKYNIPPAE